MRFLITGSGGFIGSKLIKTLQARDIEFDILKRSSASAKNLAGTIEIQWPEAILQLDLKPYSAIIHLAAAPATQSAESYLRESNLKPVANFLKRINESNPLCSFIFVTSQSAKENTESVYGKLKWEAEQLIRKHSGNWTIIRPGLVIGEGGKGLFNRLLNIVEKVPLIPLVGAGDQLIQPIGVEEVVDALIITAKDGKQFSGKDYALVGPSVSLKEFLKQSALVLNKKRIFLPIPIQVVNFGLATLEKRIPNPPITRTNLIGLLHLDLLDSTQACRELALSIPPLKETLESIIKVEPIDQLKREANYFYRTLFGRTPNPLLVERYISAHNFCCFVKSPEQQIDLSLICRNKLDAESIEYATRSRKTLLTKKFTLLTYLAEIDSENYSTFVNQKSNFFIGFFLLGLAVLRAPLKLAKGKYLVWRYRLV